MAHCVSTKILQEYECGFDYGHFCIFIHPSIWTPKQVKPALMIALKKCQGCPAVIEKSHQGEEGMNGLHHALLNITPFPDKTKSTPSTH